jgi:hypothetical protein
MGQGRGGRGGGRVEMNRGWEKEEVYGRRGDKEVMKEVLLVRGRNREERKGTLNEGRTVTAGGGPMGRGGGKERRRGHMMFT